jgi:hypothetical protein
LSLSLCSETIRFKARGLEFDALVLVISPLLL